MLTLAKTIKKWLKKRKFIIEGVNGEEQIEPMDLVFAKWDFWIRSDRIERCPVYSTKVCEVIYASDPEFFKKLETCLLYYKRLACENSGVKW